MYRTPDQKVRCIACTSESVLPPTRISAANEPVLMHFMSSVGRGMEDFRIDRARVCLDCGHIMPTMSPETIAHLKQVMSALRPL